MANFQWFAYNFQLNFVDLAEGLQTSAEHLSWPTRLCLHQRITCLNITYAQATVHVFSLYRL